MKFCVNSHAVDSLKNPPLINVVQNIVENYKLNDLIVVWQRMDDESQDFPFILQHDYERPVGPKPCSLTLRNIFLEKIYNSGFAMNVSRSITRILDRRLVAPY